jgi:16S rRNA (cytidine1402-2'-O)-methyltransferase
MGTYPVIGGAQCHHSGSAHPANGTITTCSTHTRQPGRRDPLRRTPEMAGTLFVVATPIGNLEDITLRALRVLREVDVIAAEDTRRTAKLLAHHGISSPMISFHQHNFHGRVPKLIERLVGGQSVAIVSDAGTPGLSDPGSELIDACLAAAVTVDPIPGASAPLAAVIGSGFPMIPLTILGFPPHRAKDRIEWFEDLAVVRTTVTFFESPHRIAQMLVEVQRVLGERQIVLARELTKIHQEFIRGTASSILGRLPALKGEFTIVIAPLPTEETPVNTMTDGHIATEFWRLTDDASATRGQLVTKMAKRLGLSRRAVYAALERTKGSVK